MSLIKFTNSMQPVINPQNQFIDGTLLAVFHHFKMTDKFNGIWRTDLSIITS